MTPRSTYLLAAVVLACALTVFLGPSLRSQATHVAKTSDRAAPAAEPMKIVPADVLGGPHWAPATGEN
jgi:hypothetical protein